MRNGDSVEASNQTRQKNIEELNKLENEIQVLKSEVKSKQEALVKETYEINILKERVSHFEEENKNLLNEIQNCEIIAKEKLPQLNLKNVKRDFNNLKEHNKNLKKKIIELQENIAKQREENQNQIKDNSELKERNSKIFEILREQTRKHHDLEIEVKQMKRRLGEVVTDSEIESDEE